MGKSSRIQRRNNSGFRGLGNHTGFNDQRDYKPGRDFGDYADPKQNHKKDFVNEEMTSLVNFGKKYHPPAGSKSKRLLKQYINHA